jgi:phosphoribosylanthranilate isomerase
MRLVKICGVNDAGAFAAARAAGADLIGFVFYPKSLRAVTPAQAAAISGDGSGPIRVGLFVDPPDSQLHDVLAHLRLDLLQLHGAEPPDRVVAVREKFGVPVMKVFGIGGASDLERVRAEQHAADWLMLDAKPSPHAALPGGNAEPFDWSLLRGLRLERPWLLAGGLTPENVGQAIAIADPTGVDVSSGVERARGVKDAGKISAFVRAAKRALTLSLSRPSAGEGAQMAPQGLPLPRLGGRGPG